MNIKWKNVTIALLLILIFIANTYRIKVEKENRLLSDEIEQLNIEINESQNNIDELKLEIMELEFEIMELEKERDQMQEKLVVQWNALVSATWRLETGNGTSNLWLKHNNAGGIKCGRDTYCSYESKEQGMRALEILLENYVLNYGYDIKKIREVYCQCGEQDYYDFMEVFNEELDRLYVDDI